MCNFLDIILCKQSINMLLMLQSKIVPLFNLNSDLEYNSKI